MLDEAKNINKSLSSLGNVISALAEGTVSNSISTVFSLKSVFPCKCQETFEMLLKLNKKKLELERKALAPQPYFL